MPSIILPKILAKFFQIDPATDSMELMGHLILTQITICYNK